MDIEKSTLILKMDGRAVKDMAMAVDDYLMRRGKIVDNKLVVRDDPIDKNLEKILKDLMEIWNFG